MARAKAKVMAALNLAGAALAAALVAGPALARDVAPLGEGWRFQFGDAPGAATPAFDDSHWPAVSLPHSWNRLGAYAEKRDPASDNRQGVGWYRLDYAAPAAPKGTRFWLDFAAVGSLAEVWVNGVSVCTHKGAFSRFRCDVTAQWHVGAHNRIAVRADNSRPAPGSSTQDVIPLGGDFFIHGGLYRGVSLISAAPVHIDLADHGGPGVYLATTRLTDQEAEVAVRTRIANQGKDAARGVEALVEVADAAGQVVATRRQPLAAAPGTSEITTSLALASPHRWNGRADPYLYRVTVTLRRGSQVLDSVSQPLGLRDIRIDADRGLFLNGQHLPLHGVSRHQDKLGKGWALSDADHDEDMALIAELGANTVRMAHYQHADRWVELADRYGMVAWAEIPFVNAASFGGDEGTPALHANAREQLTELVRQYGNHPSVAMWSVGNEIDIGALFARGAPPRSRALLAELNGLAHQLDPSRPTTFADCCEEDNPIPGGAKTELLAGTTDLAGYNRYFGWYYGVPAQLGTRLDHFHAIHPGLPLSVSEYGAGGAFSQHSDNPEGGPVNPFGRPHPEEYQSWYHEQSWKELAARPYLHAAWIWNMFDFVSDLREEGETVDLNDKGLVSADRKEKKDAFWFYKAQWSDQGVLHLTGKRYRDRAYPVIEVRAYANADRARLALNGADLGEVACPGRVCVWPRVALAAGANHAVVTASRGGVTLSDSADWTGPDPRAGLRIDSGALSGHGNGAVRFGSDTFFSGGKARLLNITGFGRGPRPAPKVVAGAADPTLFETWREGAFAYDLPLQAGNWRVTVRSFEPDAARAQPRDFAIHANGAMAVEHFDPARAAGGAMRAASVSFPVRLAGAGLRLEFTDAAVVAAVEVEPLAP
ncbi:MAG: beta-galactosidase [Proteobacteria bacterium]|nr:beta-galactosidase [Pseudomonadota bacterium]